MTTTFRRLCGDAGWQVLLAYEPCLKWNQREFLAHMAMEPDRTMSAGQADWAAELLERAKIRQRIERGECVLPPTLGRRVEQTQAPANDNLDHLDDLLKERGFKVS